MIVSIRCQLGDHGSCVSDDVCGCRCHRRCGKPATVRQQMTHIARLRVLRASVAEGVPPSVTRSERYLCEEHADIIDKDWIMVETVNPGDVESVLRWADRKCEWEEEE